MTAVESIVNDPWKDLRKDVFRNTEPSVKLIAITQPLEDLAKQGVTPETLPAYSARHCWESNEKYSDDPKKNNEIDKKLTVNLIKMGHDTPLQATNFVFDVQGVSKSLQAQWTRHKIGLGWSFRSTRFVEASANKFVYNTYDYIKDEKTVKELLALDVEQAKSAIEIYDKKRALGATKQDSRKVMPVAFATHCAYFANARAMRHLFKLRLDSHAEWEIRRMCAMMLDELMKYTPAIFEDQYEKFVEKKD